MVKDIGNMVWAATYNNYLYGLNIPTPPDDSVMFHNVRAFAEEANIKNTSFIECSDFKRVAAKKKLEKGGYYNIKPIS